MSKENIKYPARTSRNIAIDDLKKAFSGSVQKSGSPILAGRVVGILDNGFVLQDQSGRADLVYGRGVNVGDIVEVKVFPRAVDGGDGKKMTLFDVKDFKVLAPCLADFFIRNTDQNYKKNIVDRTRRNKMIEREKVLDGIRKFFKGRGFLEVETPQLVNLPGMEPYLDVFKTGFVSRGEEAKDMFMITSPEYAMKKLLVGGEEKVFQICKSYRNKETDSELHNPEFTLLEWYRAYASYLDIMEDTEKLVEYLTVELNGSKTLNYKGGRIDVATPWERKKVKDLFKEYAGIDYNVFEDPEKFRNVVAKKGYKVSGEDQYDDLFFKIFMNEIEPELGSKKPVIVYDYPVSMAALSKKCEDAPDYAERFEVYIAGVELCNAFTELNDPVEQKKRLEEERAQRIKMGKEVYEVDGSFIDALALGMPPSGGNALGVDRLAMLLTDTPDIKDIIYFPFGDL